MAQGTTASTHHQPCQLFETSVHSSQTQMQVGMMIKHAHPPVDDSVVNTSSDPSMSDTSSASRICDQVCGCEKCEKCENV